MADATRELVERTRAAAGDGAPLAIEGRGSKAFFGRAPRGSVISTFAHSGVIAYEPGELVITVRSGSPVSEIEALLAAQGQRLAFEPPDFGQSTIGGVLATNLSGPARPWLGSGRDTLLGAKIIDGNGEVLSFGGRVMKNVAGYDVSRFQCGGMGCYGILSEVSLRVLPAKPVTLSLSASTSDAAQAIVVMNKLGGAPLPLTGLSWLRGVLRVRFEGGAGSLAEARQALTRVAPELSFVDDEPDFWKALRHQTLPFFETAEPIWRFSISSAAAPLMSGGEWLIDWGGAQRWLRGAYDRTELEAMAVRAGGHVTCFRNGDRTAEVFQAPDAVTHRILRDLKSVFDPRGIFNPGRMYSWL